MNARVAIVGAGPAGFYAVAELLASDSPVSSVDLFDRLPTPFGLVRAGVAPDHQKIKLVTRMYDKTAMHERFRFFGQVELGADVSREDLLARYHAVIYAIGTPTDRRLGIPGEHLRGSHAAIEFVAWYNGHPDHSSLEFDLTGAHAIVVGAGNVALDVARMLALSPAELAATDAADHAIKILNTSGIQDITILARRGPLQAAFTSPELLELADLGRAEIEVVDAVLDPLSAQALAEADTTRRSNVEIIQAYAARQGTDKPICLRFRFLASPVELIDDGRGHVEAIKIERNKIVSGTDASLGAKGTGRYEELAADLVVRSIGYRGAPLADIPFDEHARLIRNEGGRVYTNDGQCCTGEYVTGWIKRGASGVIGTNKKDAQDTVNRLLEDAAAGLLNRPEADDVMPILPDHTLGWDGWQAINAVEIGAGESQGRPRVKITEWDALRQAALAVQAESNGRRTNRGPDPG